MATDEPPHRCGRRDDQLGWMMPDSTLAERDEWSASAPKLDHWRAPHDVGLGAGMSTCSYCGSMPPEVLLALIENGACVIGPTDKNYKIYVDIGDEEQAAKFYFQHFSQEQRVRFMLAHRSGVLKIGDPGHFYAGAPYFYGGTKLPPVGDGN